MLGEQIGIRCVFMRGGTSKGCYILEKDLPSDPQERENAILRIYGSPDGRQIDGMGGADALTSKIAIIKPSKRTDADVEYTFGQVGIDRHQVSYGGNCGNMLSGVGPYAIDQGLVPVEEPLTIVRIYNTNTDQVIHAEIKVKDGHPSISGDCSVSGVPGTGSAIRLNFMECQGSMTGKLLPTGNAKDMIDLDFGEVAVSLVDAATPFVFVKASSIGMKGDELPKEISQSETFMRRLEEIRSWAAKQVGVVKEGENATTVSPNVPRVALVSSPKDYQTSTGETVSAKSVSLLARQMSMQKPHQTYAVTGSICTSVASKISGTVVNEVVADDQEQIVIGHPAGIIEVEVSLSRDGKNGLNVEKVAIVRTARKIMEGIVYIPIDVLENK